MANPSANSPEAVTTMRHVMHDVRTPLTQIVGCCEMLQEEVSDRGLTDLLPDLEEIRGAALGLLKTLESLIQGGEFAKRSDLAAATASDTETRAFQIPVNNSGVSASLLVVDDEAKIRGLMLRRLERLGYSVTAVADGADALVKLAASEYDLVLLDLLMPDTSGLETLAAIRRLYSATELPVIIVSGLDASENTVAALETGANDFLNKPIDFSELHARISTQLTMRQTALDVAALSQQLEIRNSFIRRTLGRYVSDEVATSLLDDPVGLELRGEKRVITVLKTDLRGFSVLTESCDATQVVAILNRYLGAMTDIVVEHGGTVDEFQGDARIALFGAPLSHGNDAERAVAAAVDMQLTVPKVNERNIASGLPVIQMGIGIATGEAVVGNIGTQTRAKYGVVGQNINLASRIESYSLGGDVLIDEATKAALGASANVDHGIAVQPKGFSDPIQIYRVLGAADSILPDSIEELTALAQPVPIRYAVVAGDHIGEYRNKGTLCALSKSGQAWRHKGGYRRCRTS